MIDLTWLDKLLDKCFYEENYVGAWDEARQAIATKVDQLVAEARIKELQMLPVMRQGLHTPQKELDIILLDAVKQRVATLQAQARSKP